jgi:hypothetical protein
MFRLCFVINWRGFDVYNGEILYENSFHSGEIVDSVLLICSGASITHWHCITSQTLGFNKIGHHDFLLQLKIAIADNEYEHALCEVAIFLQGGPKCKSVPESLQHTMGCSMLFENSTLVGCHALWTHKLVTEASKYSAVTFSESINPRRLGGKFSCTVGNRSCSLHS